jgi:PAS domain S-box-containing protein
MEKRLGYPLRLTLLYLLIGGLWILFTDRLAALLFPNPNTLLLVNTYKGWFYVIVTAFFLYLELSREAHIRKQEEAALRLSEDKFKYVFEYSVSGKSFTQPSGAMEVNQAFCDMLGYSREELTQLKWQEITYPDDLEITQKMIDLLLSGEKDSVHFNKRFLRKDGSIVWVDLGTALRRDPAGYPLYLMTTVNDITERQRAEMAVQANEQQLKSYIESAGDAIYVIETETGRIRNCNGRACVDLGYSRNELLELSAQDIEFKLTPQEVDAVHHIVKPGEVETISGKHKRKNGTTFPVEIRLSSLAPAQPEFMLAIVRDITERKQFEDRLQRSEARYQLIFENSGTANTIFDLECRVNLQNSQSQKLTRPADALGKTALEVFGPEQGSIVSERMQRVLASGVAEVFETKFSMPAGERWIRSSYQPLLDQQEGLVGIQVISQDITPQKRAEELLRETSERLAHMFANSPTVIYALKIDGDKATPSWISENIEAILGFRAEVAMQPAWWLEQVHPEDRQTVQVSLEHLFDDFYQQDYHFLCKDGRTIWLHDEHRLLCNADNTPREIIGAWTDITERKQAEEALRDYNIRLALDVVERTRELKDAQEKLVRQEKLAVLGQLAGGVGHELRNPLAVINNAVYYLKLVQPDADENIRKYHSMIEHEVHNSEKIITDLLDFARVKSVERENLAVHELVQRVLERFPVPESIKTVLEIPPGLPQVYADPRQMEQVLGNLVVNACQAMASTRPATLAEGGTLTISASHEKELVAIAVKDTGAGILPENMHKLFEPLFTTKPKGIGLGLAVSRKLAEANGGRIEVLSDPGKGSTFTLYLPLSTSELGS